MPFTRQVVESLGVARVLTIRPNSYSAVPAVPIQRSTWCRSMGRVTPPFPFAPEVSFAPPLTILALEASMAGVIRIRTEIPGPASRALLARRAASGAARRSRGHPDRGRARGGRGRSPTPTAIGFIDFGGGIGVVNTGHRHAGVVGAVREQLDRFAHVCFPVSTYEPYVELAERLNRVTPGTREKRTFFVNSGAEAVENAVKVARAFTGRQAVVCFEHGFHGRTNLAMALTSKVMPYKKGFGPFAPEVYRIPFPYCYRCETRTGGRRTGGRSAAWRAGGSSTSSSRRPVDPGSVAAIVMELELGEGGFVPAPVEFVRALAAFAKEHGILFVADEIQTGFGRTGRHVRLRALRPGARSSSPPRSPWPAACRSRPSPAAPTRWRRRRSAAWAAPTGAIPWRAPPRSRCSTRWRRERIPERARQAGERIRARFCEWADALLLHRRRARARRDGRASSW